MMARTVAVGLLAVAVGGCGGAARAPEPRGVQPAAADESTHSPTAKANSSRQPYTGADVQFISGMIGHHAQAVRIAGWAPSHGASPAVRTLAERIAVGQQDEIALMERWLLEHREPVPSADSLQQMMAGMDHSMQMPGMLTAEQLMQLDHAHGAEFDRLFLAFMIKHHQGALTMVDRLFGSQGAAQNETVFKVASDVYADQSTEIDRMQKMLATFPSPGSAQ